MKRIQLSCSSSFPNRKGKSNRLSRCSYDIFNIGEHGFITVRFIQPPIHDQYRGSASARSHTKNTGYISRCNFIFHVRFNRDQTNSLSSPSQLDVRPDLVGIAIPGTEVWIEDEHGNRLGAGEVGELVVRGRHVMRGYWGDEELTTQRFRPAKFSGERLCYTGDLFRMDEEGYFYFVARKDDIIKSRGEKVSPKEVENVLYKIDGVHEAAVIGVADPLLGQAIKAFIVKNNSSLTETDVLRFCRNHLEDFMIPKYVQFVDELPKTSSGKIKKTELH